MVKSIDLTGKTFGLLTVLKREGSSPSGKSIWICMCNGVCGGTETKKTVDNLKRKGSSCGCARGKNHNAVEVGKVYNKLTVESLSEKNLQSRNFWNCRCTCGLSTVVRDDKLKDGSTKSCGCLFEEVIVKHGHKRRKRPSRTYKSWESMIQRCYNPNAGNYHKYGAKGITVCQRWIDSFESFLEDMGERPPNKTIDRIEGAFVYSKESCKWSTNIEQNNNKSNTKHIIWNSKKYPRAVFSEAIGLNYNSMVSKLRAGKSIETIVAEANISKDFVNKVLEAI